jgi:hypothetical protein
MYGRVLSLAAQRSVRSWPVALSLVVYAVIVFVAMLLLKPVPGLLAGFLLGFVLAACWSSYLDLISQAVRGSKISIRWDDFKSTFGTHFWDVISVMFAFWIIGFLTGPLTAGPNGEAMRAILGIAMAFFFNPVPELLYQGNSRSFALLLDSGRFMLANPAAWLLPNLVFMAAMLAPTGLLRVEQPAELLLLFGNFYSPGTIMKASFMLPPWSWPLLLAGVHFVMVFRGILFEELSTSNPRARAWAARAR